MFLCLRVPYAADREAVGGAIARSAIEHAAATGVQGIARWSTPPAAVAVPIAPRA